MANILSSIACNLDTDILSAALPLFEAEQVEAMEWSFDTLYKHRNIPNWFVDLLSAFSQGNRLIGHGVYFSLFAGRWSKEQDQWLQHLEKVCSQFHFDHITEHFGFMTGAHFHAGAPISVPLTPATLALGRDRLKRIAQACHCPVGLENLAFAYSLDEVKAQGDFLEQLIEPINGFIILDLHNLYCQIHNFKISFDQIIYQYPLHRVREIHISGGSWENSTVEVGTKVRRDTHDDAVPTAVFQLLSRTIPLCPNLKYVVLEQLGMGLKTEISRSDFQEDFQQMKQIIQTIASANDSTPLNDFLVNLSEQLRLPCEDFVLHEQQQQLSTILETAADTSEARQRLAHSALANTAWKIEEWEPQMLETALKIAQKWKHGFTT